MKICILGGTGQLGYELNNVLKNKNIVSLGKKSLDIRCFQGVYETLEKIKPDVVIHAAGFTDVDECEIKKEIAFNVNTVGTSNVAKTCKKIKAKLVYISSDYVFDGKSSNGYDENHKPNPINVYGQSKYQGELEIQNNMDEYFIIRTSCLFASRGKNFINSILSLSNNKSIIRVVNDQICCPTYAKDLAEAIAGLLHDKDYGKYHLVNSGSATWYDLAKEVLMIKNIEAKILAVSSDEIERKALRPKNSTLNNNSSIKMRSWQEALEEYLNERRC